MLAPIRLSKYNEDLLFLPVSIYLFMLLAPIMFPKYNEDLLFYLFLFIY